MPKINPNAFQSSKTQAIELETQFVPKRRIASVEISKHNSRSNSIKMCSEKDIEDLKLEITE